MKAINSHDGEPGTRECNKTANVRADRHAVQALLQNRKENGGDVSKQTENQQASAWGVISHPGNLG